MRCINVVRYHVTRITPEIIKAQNAKKKKKKKKKLES